MNDQFEIKNSESEREDEKEVVLEQGSDSNLQNQAEGSVVPSAKADEPIFSEETEKEEQNSYSADPTPSVGGFTKPTQPVMTEAYLKFLEKKEIRSAANAIGMCFLAGHLFMLILNLAYSVVGGVVSDLYENGAAIITDPIVIHTIEIVWSICIFLIPYIFVAKFCGYKVGNLVLFRKPEKADFLPFTLIGMGYCALVNALISRASSFFTVFEENYNYSQHENPKGILGFTVAVISIVIIPGLLEEFAVRGIVMGLIKRFGEGFAIVVSALLFGFMHRNFIQIPFAFLTGLGLGYIAVKTRTIWIAALVHGINNFISILTDYGHEYLDEGIVNSAYVLYLLAAVIFGVIGVILLSSRKDFYHFAPTTTRNSVSEKFRTVIYSPTVLIYIIICLFEAISYFFV